MNRALSYFSENAYFQEKIAGIDFYDLIDDLEKNFQEKKGEIIENLKELMSLVFRREYLIVSYTQDEEGY